MALSRQSSFQQEEKSPLYFRNPSYNNNFAPVQQSPAKEPSAVPINEDILQIEVNIPQSQSLGFEKKTEFVKIHKTREVTDLYNSIRKLLKNEGRWTADVKDIKVVFKNAILNENQTLK